MCSVLGPKHPATKSTKEIIENEEKKLDMKKLLKQSIDNIKIIRLC